MSVRIRLARVGKKGHPSYRIVVAEVTAPRDGSYLEWIGNYDPMMNPPTVTLKQDRAAHWLKMGALPTDAVARILDQQGLMERTHTFKTRGAVAAAVEAPGAATAVADAPVDEAPADEAAVEETPAEEPAAEEPAAEEEAAEE
ncbi:MAG: 30S ribosomal protein S16 [Chloroflexi bacterium]|nr:30S ribosomal protein S16 [Chloroflexota bacterium]